MKIATSNKNINFFSKFFESKKYWVIFLLISIGITAFVAKGGTTAPSIPAINLSSDPLYAASGGDKPVLALALSVEYPTVGAQYVASPGATTDSTYSNTNEYLGYYDAESCYTYNNAPTETPASGLTTTDYKRFDRSGAATSRKCSNAFSGNFLNWASNSAIDMLRLALSGGDRYIDTASLTILQRAVIPNGDPICMWNSSNFPAKQLQKDGGGTGKYWGAVPTYMVTQAAGSDIWVANTLNRIYFGTSNTGSCTSTTAYTLGGAGATGVGPVQSGTSLPSDASAACASENGTCSFSGIKEVWYGAGTHWNYAPASNGVSCSNAVFGDPIVGTGKNCYTRTYSGTWSPTSTGALNSDGFFYARVNVCGVDSSNTLLDVRDYGLCKNYPNGNYKPTGSIQKYSDQLRLSAFGYLLDQTNSESGALGRYGGVLRAPMKYVGAKTFDINGLDNTASGGNPNVEWNINTGVFNANPDGDTTQTPAISGVVNYLNKFGRTGPVQGKYKIYDPVGELYYENLRYLQGLQPSPAAISNITTAMYDGFPVTTTWTDPYGSSRSNTADYSCLKSNIVVIGDINTHDGNKLPTANASANIPDIGYWTGIVQNFERNYASTYTDGQGASRTTGNPNNPTNGNPPGNQIIGEAYWAHTHDIRGTAWTAGTGPSLQRPGLRVRTYLFDVNEYGASNNASTRQYSNQFFTAAKYGGFESDSSNPGGKPYNAYGNPFKQQDGTTNNNVWQDTANPGEASTYYLQSSARGVLNAFDSIFSRAATAARSIAGSAVQNKNLTQTGSTIYQGSFDTSDWSGDVLAFPVSVSSTNVVTVSTSTSWTASAQLAAMTTARNIIVGSVGSTANPVANDFTWASINADLKVNLAKLTPTSTADSLAQDRLNYLRGDKSKEGNPFRTRSKLLGDIINSSIVYSGAPASGVLYSSSYASFYTSNVNRTPAVFVGSNDGMLHAFKATTGDELFAYIPSWMGPKLAALTSTTYPSNHQSYVDGPPVVTEAQVGSAGTAADWKTVLVSGTGAGGSGVFALDVTNPSTFSASNVMWEFTRNDDNDMGFVVGRPQIMKLRTSAPGAAATYRWFALVASGVNNYTVADSSGSFGSGYPALFLLALDKPVGTAWTATGSSPNYYKISLPVDGKLDFSTALTTTPATGLINFRATYGSLGELAQVYMGDLHGKVWKLDFSLYGSTNWNINKLSPYIKSSLAFPLYIAKNSSGIIQPISMAPSVVSGPIIQGINTNYIAFGTGKYLESTDKTATNQNSIYVVYDNGSSTADSSPAGNSVISSRGRLIAGTASSGVISVAAFQWGRAASDTDSTQRSGWYVDFPTSGEREISNAVISGDNLIFGTLIPAASGATGSCAAAGGSGNEYIVSVDTGNGTYKQSTVGVLGEPMVVDLTSATTYTTSDSTGRRIKTVTKQVIQQGSTGLSSSTTSTVTSITGRLSWRQINNYQYLKNQP
ncbi:pilus assembly protein [Rhodoferax sp.]|uniref:pilus assembly protein n=1 Tax=Rhodoferax sp. TaxID=50421 RepID=UPI00374DE186